MPKFEVKKADDAAPAEEIEMENQDAQEPAAPEVKGKCFVINCRSI